MSREAYLAEARAIVAQAQQAAADDMRALQAKHQQRLQDTINKLGASASRNGERPNLSGFILPNVTQVLTLGRPNQVFNISYM